VNENLALLTFNPVPFFKTTVTNEREIDRRATDRENSARQGTSEHKITTRGVGLLRLTAPVVFDIPFLTEPHFASGFALVAHPDPKVWGDPYATLGIRKWVRNAKGHYTGAYMYLKVSIDVIDQTSPDAATYPDVTMVHFASFTGLAFKDLGTAVLAAAHTLTPRVPGFGSA